MLYEATSFRVVPAFTVVSFGLSVAAYPLDVAGDASVLVTTTGNVVAAIVAGDADVTVTATCEVTASAAVAGAATITVTSTGALVVDPLTLLSTRLHFWFDAQLSPQTLNGANVSQLDDLSSFGYHAAQSNDALRPQVSATGGPNNLARITFSGTTQRVVNTAIALASNKALSFYCIAKQVASTQRSQAQVRTGADETAGDILFVAFQSSGNQYLSVVRCHSAAEEADFITSPAADASYHMLSTKYTTGIAPVFEVDDVGVSPTHTTTGQCGPVETIMIGNTSGAGGEFFMFLCAESVSAGEDTAIRDYFRIRTGIG